MTPEILEYILNAVGPFLEKKALTRNVLSANENRLKICIRYYHY